LYNRPEIVLFGVNPEVTIRGFLNVNKNLIIKNSGPGRATITLISAGRDNRVHECATDLKSLLAGLAEVGANYGDWVNFVRLCGAEKLIPCEVAMNPMPLAGRKYDRDGANIDSDTNAEKSEPISELKNIPAANPEEDGSSNRSWINPFTWFSSK
jgi:hypothetical protein